MGRLPLFAIAHLAAALVGCGARPDLGSGTDPSGSIACLSWHEITPEPVALTEPQSVQSLASIAADGDQIYVGYSAFEDDESAWRVLAISADLASIGPSQVVMKDAAPNFR